MTTPTGSTVPVLLPGQATAVLLDADGTVANVVVVDPATVTEYEAALHREAQERGRTGPTVRTLTADEHRQGVGIGWRRSANGRFVDERPPAPARP